MADPLKTFDFGQWTALFMLWLWYACGHTCKALCYKWQMESNTGCRQLYLHFVSISEKYFVLFRTPHIETIYCKALKSRAMGIWLFRRNLEKVQF
jgi:hypothetical protein